LRKEELIDTFPLLKVINEIGTIQPDLRKYERVRPVENLRIMLTFSFEDPKKLTLHLDIDLMPTDDERYKCVEIELDAPGHAAKMVPEIAVSLHDVALLAGHQNDLESTLGNAISCVIANNGAVEFIGGIEEHSGTVEIVLDRLGSDI